MAQQEFEQKQKLYEQISPLATLLMGLGISPEQFMQSTLGQSILGEQRAGVSGEFDAARQNLIEGLGSTGMYGSGIGVGPLANLYSNEAIAQAKLINQLPMTGLNLGLQGAGILQNQQGLLDPLGFQSAAVRGFTTIPQGQWGQRILGSVGAALNPIATILGGYSDG